MNPTANPNLSQIREMKKVTEVIDAFPDNEDVNKIERREELLLRRPTPGPMKFWRDFELLPVAHFNMGYVPMKFAPPRDVFACDSLRLEWQQMNARQPFYHRNGDVDEISFQVSGERTLMTELGTVELRPGDYSRIPVGIAHDNYGREEVHLLFYIRAPAVESGKVVRQGEYKNPVFDGWKPACKLEMMTDCLGARGCDTAVSPIDEELLLDPRNHSFGSQSKLSVQRANQTDSGVEWMYKSEKVWIGNVHLHDAMGDSYRRHMRADAIHCQITGTRTLVTQRGIIELHPGDFVSVPRGCAYTSIVAGEATHIVILSNEEASLKAEISKQAEQLSLELVTAARARVRGANSHS